MSKVILHKNYELQQKEVNVSDVMNNEESSYTLLPDNGYLLNKVTIKDDYDCVKEYVEKGGKMAYSTFSKNDIMIKAAPYITDGTRFFYYAYCTDNSDLELNLLNCTTAEEFFYDFNYVIRGNKNAIVQNLVVNLPNCTTVKNFFLSLYNRAYNSSGWRNIKMITSDKLVNCTQVIRDNAETVSLEITECKSCDNDFDLYRCHALKNLLLWNYGEGFTKPHTMYMRYVNFMPFTRDTFMAMINSLADISSNEKASGSVIDITTKFASNLTDEDKELITSKGWTLTIQ